MWTSSSHAETTDAAHLGGQGTECPARIDTSEELELQNQLALTLNRYREDSPEALELKGIDGDGWTRSSKRRRRSSRNPRPRGLELVTSSCSLPRSTLRSELEGHNASVQAMEAIGEMRDRPSLVPDVQNHTEAARQRPWDGPGETPGVARRIVPGRCQSSAHRQARPRLCLRIVDYAVPPSSRWWPRLKIPLSSRAARRPVARRGGGPDPRLAGGRVRRNTWGRRTGDALIYGQIVVATYGHPLRSSYPARQSRRRTQGSIVSAGNRSVGG